MILPDDTPPSPSKSQQALLGGRTSDSNSHTPEQNNPPPAYPGYASYQRNHPLPQASAPRRPLPIPPVRSPQITVYDEPAGRRFVKAFCVAILIWTVLGLFTRSIIEIGSPRHRNVGALFLLIWSSPRCLTIHTVG